MIKEFKMKVTPEQSRAVQEILFAKGVCWANGAKEIKHTTCKYLYVEKNGIDSLVIYRGTMNFIYDTTDIPEIPADVFIKNNGNQISSFNGLHKLSKRTSNT